MVKGFNPPTRTECPVCEAASDNLVPHIDSHRGKASASDNFPIHNWFNFTLGYTPEFPEFLLRRLDLPTGSLVGDPFLGAGTTSVVAKSFGYKSIGIEANDYFAFAAKTKLNWKVDSTEAENILETIEKRLVKSFSKYLWPTDVDGPYIGDSDFTSYAQRKRPDELVERYISDAPLAKLELIKDELEKIEWPSKEIKNFFYLALTSCVLPVSNVKYGPGFGVVKPKLDAPVFSIFMRKANRMILDLRESHVAKNKNVSSIVKLGDARKMTSYMGLETVDALITSPPYPGDHEYTKHSRLELMFMDIARTKEEFRVIKKRMLRGSTTNIYKEDNEGERVRSLKSIHKIVNEIDARLKADGATSGFEKLYTKLIWEYFGGMYLVFEEAMKVLKPGGSFSLLVSDSHAFKMVHISTADLLAEVAKLAGFKKAKIELWQYKKSTSHKFKMYENILTVYKPI